MYEDELDLHKEVLSALKKAGLKQSSIINIARNKRFLETEGKETNLQRTMLTMFFYDLVMYQPKEVPENIRIAMNIATDSKTWLEDIITTVIPFIAGNEEDFFPNSPLQ